MAQATNVVDLTLEGGMHFQARDARGATAHLDTAPPEGSGEHLTPMEFLLAGLGGCTAIDVISILRKKRLDVTDYRIQVTGTRADTHPRVYTEITVRHIVTGRNIPEAAVHQAVELSEEKYCSAHAMLSQAAKITTTFEIREAEGEPVSA